MPRQAHNYTHKDTVWVVEDRSMITVEDDILKSHLAFEVENREIPDFIKSNLIFKNTYRMINNGYCTYHNTKYKVHIDKNLVNYIVLND